MSDTPPPSSSPDALVSTTIAEVARLVERLAEGLREQHAEALRTAAERASDERERAIRQASDAEAAAREQAVAEAVMEAGQQFARAEQALLAAAQSASSGTVTSQAGERELRLEAMERLLRSIVRLDEADSLLATFDTLAEAAAGEAPRSVLFLVRGSELRAWRATGIAGVAPDAGDLRCDAAVAGPLADAAREGHPVDVHPEAFAADPAHPLAALGLGGHQAGLAVPLVVDARTVAVLYADDGEVSDREVPACWPEAVQVLARHAARCLESLVARRARTESYEPGRSGSAQDVEIESREPDPDSARRFARLLVSELKLYNEKEVEVGRRAGDLLQRLAGPIERARRQYEARVPADLPGRDDYFQQELVRTLAEGDAEVLGSRRLTGA